jgi:hypothetical protein
LKEKNYNAQGRKLLKKALGKSLDKTKKKAL